MILTLDVGNTQIFGGVFDGEDDLKIRFRKNTHSARSGISSDELGLFLRAVLRENGIPPEAVEKVAICSVVPNLMHSLRNCCAKYFGRQPFVLQAGVKTGLNIKYRIPNEVGADRIANAVAAIERHPGKNLIVVDFGTATTFCAVTARRDYLGGIICPGLKISMEALESSTAKLPKVEIVRPVSVVGRSTVECIQSGLYFGNLGMLQTVIPRIRREFFGGDGAVVVGTGGFSRLFEDEKIFDDLEPDLVHYGLLSALKMNW